MKHTVDSALILFCLYGNSQFSWSISEQLLEFYKQLVWVIWIAPEQFRLNVCILCFYCVFENYILQENQLRSCSIYRESNKYLAQN